MPSVNFSVSAGMPCLLLCLPSAHEWEDFGFMYCGNETSHTLLVEQKDKFTNLLFKLAVLCDRL